MASIPDIKIQVSIDDPAGALEELVEGLKAHGAAATPELRRFCTQWITRNVVETKRVAPVREVMPRVWVGNETIVRQRIWVWDNGYRQWVTWAAFCLTRDSVFVVASSKDKPTIDPSKMTSIDPCSEVDWA